MTGFLINVEPGGMVYLDVGGFKREAVVRITGSQNNCEVSSCVFGDLFLMHYAARSQWESGRFLVFVFPFSCGENRTWS